MSWVDTLMFWLDDTPSDPEVVGRDLDRQAVQQWPGIVEHYQDLGNEASDQGDHSMAFRLWRTSGYFEAHRNDLEAGR